MLTKLFASTIICGPPSRTYSTLVTSLSRCSNSMLYMLCSFGLNNSLLPAKCPLEGVSPNYTVSACLGNFGSKILFGMINSVSCSFLGPLAFPNLIQVGEHKHVLDWFHPIIPKRPDTGVLEVFRGGWSIYLWMIAINALTELSTPDWFSDNCLRSIGRPFL